MTTPRPKVSPALIACQAIADATQCTPTLALDLGIKVAARRLPLAQALAAARLGTPGRGHPFDLDLLAALRTPDQSRRRPPAKTTV